MWWLLLAMLVWGGVVEAQTAGPWLGIYTTVGTSPVQVLGQVNGASLLDIRNESLTATVACTLDGTLTKPATTPVVGSVGTQLAPQTDVKWPAPGASFVPTSIVTCIASASGTPVTAERQ